MIRTNSFLKNMKVSMFFYIMGILVTFISRSIFINILGAEITGLSSLYTSLIGFLNVAELGIGIAVGYSLYKPLANNNYNKINEIMILFKHYYKNISKLVFIFGVISSIFLPLLIKGQVNYILAYIYYFLYLINCVLSYLFSYKQTLIISDQKQYKILPILNWIKILKIIIQCYFIYIIKSFFVWLVIEVVFNVLGMYLANKKIDLEYGENITYSSNKDIDLIKKENKDIANNIRDGFFHKISGFIVFQTDTILISIFSTLREIAIYTNYLMIINALSGIITNVIGSIMPSIGNLIAEEAEDKSYSIFRKLYALDHIIAIFTTIVTYHIIDNFIIIWVGEKYLFSKYYVLALIVNLYIQIARGSIDRFKNGFGIFWDIKAPILESCINLIISIILGNYIGIIGVFIGTIISNIIIVEIWRPYIVFKYGFKISIKRYIFQLLNIWSKNIIVIVGTNYIYNRFNIYIQMENLFINLIFNLGLIIIITSSIICVVYIGNREFKEIYLLCKKYLFDRN